jgi:hypothetical protein
VVACPQHDVPQVTTACVAPHVHTMVVVVEGRAAHQGQHPHRTPRELVPRVPLRPQQHLPEDPKHGSEAMSLRPQDHEAHSRRQLLKTIFTMLLSTRSTGCIYSVEKV